MKARERIAWLAGVLAVMASQAAAQSFVGLDPVKVKTIPMGPTDAAPNQPFRKFPAAAAALPTGSSLSSAAPLVPVTKVKTFRVDRNGHVVDKADAGMPTR